MYKELNLCFIALTLVLVGGRRVTNAPQGYLKRAILIDIKQLLDSLPKDEEELYTPENTVKCAREALICYVEEIDALAQETDDRNIKKIIGNIQKNIGAALNYTSSTKSTGLNSTQSSEPSKVTLTPPFTSRREEETAAQMNVCPPCESHELQKTEMFLQRMIQFVQFAFSDSGLKEH